MIDLNRAKIAFANYVSRYNPEDGKIALKIRHIYRVAEISRKIAVKNGYSDKEQNLAELIGLLHDIGRFEQIRIYNTFNDKKSVNHGEMGVRILFEEGLIREFIEKSDYDDIIKTAITNHNKYRIDSNITGRTLDFCKIIRDADKLDIYYVLNTEKIEDAYEKEDISEEVIGDEIYREFKEDKIIDYKKRKSPADVMVSHIAYIFDFNYDYCLKKIREERYIERLVEKAKYKNEDTIKKMNEIVSIANRYIDERL